MTTFRIGQRVRTTVAIDQPSLSFSAPIGTMGTIEMLPTPDCGLYAVLLDNDPDQLPTAYTADELNPA